MTPRALCDTNVLVSAFIAAGPPSRVIEAVIDRRLDLVLAEPVLDELERVLTIKLGFETKRVREIVAFLDGLASARVGAPAGAPEPVSGDADDDVILACGVDAGVQLIVSGDRKHLLPLVEYRGIRIVTPQALLAGLANA
ncbi:MAG TPA: putative toxin-antitoxin system toxin component, PIN family [Solirubrobacteraceae bacterium]|nr:putative toxin-antitoxin system toxin component, PIN family [Solirubrobacteraceae bacterium]